MKAFVKDFQDLNASLQKPVIISVTSEIGISIAVVQVFDSLLKQLCKVMIR